MQAAATSKLAYEQAEKNRQYQLQEQQAQASLYHQAAQQRLQSQGQAQSAYEFDARQSPSARDVFEADQQAQAQQRSFGNQAALNSQALSQSEQMRLSNLQRQEDYFTQQADQGSYNPEQRAEGLAQLHGLIGPLRLRQETATAQAVQQQQQALQGQIAAQEAVQQENARFRSQTLNERISTVQNPDTGETMQLFEQSPNHWAPLEWQGRGQQQAQQREQQYLQTTTQHHYDQVRKELNDYQAAYQAWQAKKPVDRGQPPAMPDFLRSNDVFGGLAQSADQVLLGGSGAVLPAAERNRRIMAEVNNRVNAQYQAVGRERPGQGSQQPDQSTASWVTPSEQAAQGGARQPGQPLSLAQGIQALLDAPRPRPSMPNEEQRTAQIERGDTAARENQTRLASPERQARIQQMMPIINARRMSQGQRPLTRDEVANLLDRRGGL